MYVAGVAGAALLGAWLVFWILAAVGLLALGPGWQMVGHWISAWLLRTFFQMQGKESRLGDFRLQRERTAEHQFCATDLERGTPFYFSTKGGGRVYSEVYGRGCGMDIPLHVAVRASAAYPPPFPPVHLRLKGRKGLKPCIWHAQPKAENIQTDTRSRKLTLTGRGPSQRSNRALESLD